MAARMLTNLASAPAHRRLTPVAAVALAVCVSVLSAAAPVRGQATAPTTAPVTTQPVSIDTSTPRAAVRTLAAALYAGDADALRVVLYAGTTELEREITTATIDMAVALATFRQAAVAQFGEADVAEAMADPVAQQGAAVARIDSAVETITGDTATLGQPNEPPVVLKRATTGWTVVTGAVSPSDSPDAVQERIGGIQRQAEVLRFMAEDIRADRHRSMREVLTLLHGQMMKAATEPRPAAGEIAPSTTGTAE
jgi:hypothetical protein